MMVYRCPGEHHAPVGTYDFKGVEESELQAALDAGWFLTLSEAMAGEHAKPVMAGEPDILDSPRAELEQKARELGLSFSPRISDTKLAQRISEAL